MGKSLEKEIRSWSNCVQDGDHEPTRELALTYEKDQVQYMNNLAPTAPMKRKGENPAYYRIAAHYKFALDNLFLKEHHPRVRYDILFILTRLSLF